MGCLCEEHANYQKEWERHQKDVVEIENIKRSLTDDFSKDKNRYMDMRQDRRKIAADYFNRMLEEPEQELFVTYKPFNLFEEPDIWRVKTPRNVGFCRSILNRMGLNEIFNRWEWQSLILQTLIRAFSLFMLWSMITMFFFFVGMFLYREAIKMSTTRVISEMSQDQQMLLVRTI